MCWICLFTLIFLKRQPLNKFLLFDMLKIVAIYGIFKLVLKGLLLNYIINNLITVLLSINAQFCEAAEYDRLSIILVYGFVIYIEDCDNI